MIGGPVLSALAVEHAPPAQRGRYLAMIQLAWQLATTASPAAYTWLLERGAGWVWWVLIGQSMLGVAAAAYLRLVCPLARTRITNQATADTHN
jgi:MFS family permease